MAPLDKTHGLLLKNSQTPIIWCSRDDLFDGENRETTSGIEPSRLITCKAVSLTGFHIPRSCDE
jgi:hypothetical protein